MTMTEAEILAWWKKCGLSIDKPIAQRDHICAWSHEPNQHVIPKGRIHVRAVYEDPNGEFQSDHICVECWTSK